MDKAELKLRQMTNQHLLTPVDKLTVAHDLCGLQAQFFPNACHALRIRCADYDEATLATGLVKNWTIRGTVHVFAADDLPLFLHCNGGKDYRSDNWHGFFFWNQRDKWALTPERQRFLANVILSALADGAKTREELKEICREAGMEQAEEESMFDPWGGGIRQLCERGFMHYVVQEKKAFCLTPPFTPIPEEEAKLEMARRYFTHMGPASVHDAQYFFHTTAKEVRVWLARLPVSEAMVGGVPYYWIDTGERYHKPVPDCLFLAGFDPLLLAYEKKESLYLPPEYLRRIFNLAGIVMPPVLLYGTVAGRWKMKNGKLSVERFRDFSAAEEKLVTATAEAMWGQVKKIEMV